MNSLADIPPVALSYLSTDRAPYRDIADMTINLVLTTCFAVTQLLVPEVQHIYFCVKQQPSDHMHWCSFTNAVQTHAFGHCIITSICRQSHGVRTSHAMIIKAFRSPKGSPGCMRKDERLLPLPDGAVLSLLFMKQLALNSGRIP